MDSLVFLNALTALVVIIDPIGTALIFNALATQYTSRKRMVVAAKAVVISMLLLVAFAVYGQGLLARLGISIDALRVSGGLLLFYTAFHMVTRRLDFSTPEGDGDISVFPMSVPLIAGPGSLTMSILLYSGAASIGQGFSVIAAILVVGLVTLVSLVIAFPIKRLIGRTGDEVLRRFLGVLLAALAIQFILEGVSGFVQTY